MTAPRRRTPRPPEVVIRPATAGDLSALARLGARLAREHHAMDPERFFLPEAPIEEGYAGWLGKELANPRAAILAAVSGVRGRIVGYAYGRLEPRDWSTLRDRCGVGVDLWVEPAARGAGTGGRLVEALADALAARGARSVVIDVAARNPRAARLFRRMGFRPTMLELAREVPDRGRAPRRRAGARGPRR
jgi:ribosomal protein S18 acetylase RimI-like enzyme